MQTLAQRRQRQRRRLLLQHEAQVVDVVVTVVTVVTVGLRFVAGNGQAEGSPQDLGLYEEEKRREIGRRKGSNLFLLNCFMAKRPKFCHCIKAISSSYFSSSVATEC